MRRMPSWLLTIPQISLETANKFYTWGWRASLAGAVVTAIGVIFLFWGTHRRDQDFDLQIASLNHETALLQKSNLELKKNVVGRQISDEQHDQVLAATKDKKLPELVTYIVRDPEAKLYGVSLAFLFQELGMKGNVVFLNDLPPDQTGVVYCGTGTPEDVAFSQILMDAKIVGVGNPGGKWGHDKNGNDIVQPFCPPGSVFVGLRNPLNEIRMPARPPK